MVNRSQIVILIVITAITQKKLMKLLINNKFVSRELINEKVLGLKKNIDSKSFDAHLYRLRIKLSHVSDEIIIKSNNIHKIELIKLIK